jgi:outer membrane protein assembly factor BamE (lipoprotein component of BamABCDE complex)
MAPIPTAEHKRDDMPGRQNITSEAVEALKPGISRLQVLQQLGTPDGVFEQDRTFVYLWSNCAGYFTWFIYTGSVAGGSAGAMPVGKGYALIIEFDDAGALQRHQTLFTNNWVDWEGPRVDRTVFPQAVLNPSAAPPAGNQK